MIFPKLTGSRSIGAGLSYRFVYPGTVGQGGMADTIVYGCTTGIGVDLFDSEGPNIGDRYTVV